MKDKFENKGDIRTFMGKIQFFGQWIKDLGELAASLYANLKDEVPEKFTEKEWTPECTKSGLRPTPASVCPPPTQPQPRLTRLRLVPGSGFQPDSIRRRLFIHSIQFY